MEADVRFVIFALLLVAFTASSAAASSTGWIGGQVFAFPPESSDATLQVKPLDDPANPYKDQYSEFDRWAWQHYCRNINPGNDADWQLGLSQAQGIHPLAGPEFIQNETEDYSRGLRMVSSAVDDNGYMIPHYDYVHRVASQGGEAPATLGEVVNKTDNRFPPHARFWSLGALDAAVGKEIDAARDLYLATAYPFIPDWIAQSQQDAVFLPDGSVVTFDQATSAQSYIARRFDKDGKLLKEANVSDEDHWQHELLGGPRPEDSANFKSFDIPLPGGYMDTTTNAQDVGWRYVVLGGGKQVLSVIDYWEGRELTAQGEGNAVLEKLPVDYKYFSRLNHMIIEKVYQAQQSQTGK